MLQHVPFQNGTEAFTGVPRREITEDALIDDPQASFAASTTFLKSITVVTGPTPPGTGVM
jgi:hypothetical protein